MSNAFKWTRGEGQIAPFHADGTVNLRGLTAADIGVALQPIVDACDGSPFAYEALVRCRVETLKSPQVLFALAEKQQACGPLGRMIREAAFDAAGDVPLFVNIHPAELVSHWLVQPDDPIGFHSRQVYLEITETAAFQYFDLCMSSLREVCQRTGAKLVVDDFGAGHSNLQRLLELEPNVVKLDMQLIRNVHNDRKKRIAVRHVVALCADLGAKTVAEGIETLDELLCVRDLGVDWLQGYLLAKPGNPAPSVHWPAQAPLLPPHTQAHRHSLSFASAHPPTPPKSGRPATRSSLNPPPALPPAQPPPMVPIAGRYTSSKAR